MANFLKEANSFAKNFLLFTRVGYLLAPFSGFFRFISNFSLLTKWVGERKDSVSFSDFYKPVRNYHDRIKLYEHVSETAGLKDSRISYLEFGVAGAASLKWWIAHNSHPDTRFHGFDTFEGLPENWAFYKKGAMSFALPDISDPRAYCYKGLFQDTLYPFLKEEDLTADTLKVIHMDADLYSSTLFVLTVLAPYLHKGDLLFFDEFNVPNHEFAAWNDFIRSYYIEYEVLGAVNNFYQTCFRITRTPFQA